MKEVETWKGTKEELKELVEFIKRGIIRELEFENMTEKEINKVFCEAITRNIVVNEIKDVVKSIVEEGEYIEKLFVRVQ